MNRETARQELRKAGNRILAGISVKVGEGKDGEPRFVCLFCQNGRDGDGDGITSTYSKNGEDIVCNRCGFRGDIISFYMKHTGNGYNEAVEELADFFLHETIDGGEFDGTEAPDTAQNPPDLPVSHAESVESTSIPPKPQNAPQPSERAHSGIDREEAKGRILREVKCTDYLEKSRGELYCCPFCGSGKKKNKTGAVKYYPETNTVCCYGGCQKKKYDVIDIYRQTRNCDFNEALSELSEQIGLSLDSGRPQSKTTLASKSQKTAQNAPELSQNRTDGQEAINVPSTAKNATQPSEGGEKGKVDYTEYYRTCKRRLKDPRALFYLSGRGISEATAGAYWIGFDPKYINRRAAERAKEAGKNPPPPSERIIIPISEESFLARAIDPDAFIKVLNENSPGIFNKKVLEKGEVKEIFVVEGAFDALSFLEIGFPAIALNSTSNARSFIEMLEGMKPRPKAKLILCMDNDEAGQKATAFLTTELKRLNLPFTLADEAILNGCKDANEALVADRRKFTEAVTRQVELTSKPDGAANYILSGLMGAEQKEFRSGIKTGFAELDEKTGGLYPGLYVLGAVSSLGKTTFIHQMADQMAQAGQDVIFFSLEQSRLEMVSKSLARRTAQADMKNAVDSMKIRKGYNPPIVQQAQRDYVEKVGNKLSIVELNMEGGFSYIESYTRDYIDSNSRTDAGRHPVIIIDYLQILQPDKMDGQPQNARVAIDSTVTALKRLSRELSITVIVISSFNRSNYLTTVAFESFKESGGIEYTADVVFGMQLQCLNDELFGEEKKLKEKREKEKKAKAADLRKIELVCLKNRYGKLGDSYYFDYYSTYDLFKQGANEKKEPCAALETRARPTQIMRRR